MDSRALVSGPSRRKIGGRCLGVAPPESTLRVCIRRGQSSPVMVKSESVMRTRAMLEPPRVAISKPAKEGRLTFIRQRANVATQASIAHAVGAFHLRPNQPGRALRDRRAGMSRHKLRSWSANGIPPAPQQA